MLTDIEFLWRLQKVDDQIKELKAKSEPEDLNQNIKEKQKEIDLLKEELEKYKTKLEDLRQNIKEKEFEDSRLERKGEDYEKQLYSGENSNPKELKQLNEKLDKVEKQKSNLEDKLLDLMVEEEELQEKISEKKSELANKQKKLKQLQTDKEKQREKIKRKLNELKQEREEITEELNNDILEKYNKLYDNKHGRAVVELKDGFCMGCRMSLSLNLRKEAKSGAKLVTCEQCGRIIYWNE